MWENCLGTQVGTLSAMAKIELDNVRSLPAVSKRAGSYDYFTPDTDSVFVDCLSTGV